MTDIDKLVQNCIINRDDAFSSIVNYLEEVKDLTIILTNHSIRNVIIKEAIKLINTYIDTEDILYEEKQKLNIKTKTRYYDYIPSILFNTPIIRELRPSFQLYHKEQFFKKRGKTSEKTG